MNESLLPGVVLTRRPAARARVRGSEAYPALLGEVLFYPLRNGGSIVAAAISGLPGDGFFAFHIHAGRSCTTGGDVAFFDAGGHFDPGGRAHPDHAGDMPVLLSCKGSAYSLFRTDRFSPEEVVGRTVILHEHPDDYHSDPSGHAGNRIACGRIEAVH